MSLFSASFLQWFEMPSKIFIRIWLYICVVLMWHILQNVYNQNFWFIRKFFLVYDKDVMWLFHLWQFYLSLFHSKLIISYSVFSYQFLIATHVRIFDKFLHFYTFLSLFLSWIFAFLFYLLFNKSSWPFYYVTRGIQFIITIVVSICIE